jgi:CheY-like chemotaxis protein
LAATDGASGLDLARAHRPDLILTDARLPELTGIEICRALKSNERTREIPIIMLTSWPEYRSAARMAGCDGFLEKPVPISTLWHEVEALIGRRSAT